MNKIHGVLIIFLVAVSQAQQCPGTECWKIKKKHMQMNKTFLRLFSKITAVTRYHDCMHV